MKAFAKIAGLSLIIGLFFLGYQPTEAANLYTASSDGNLRVGDSFVVTVYVNTEGVAINNADSAISFPTDILTVQSLNSAGSIFTLWVEDPNFSNTTGTISFVGGLPTPGYTGNNGKILSITFKAKKSGIAQIYFNAGSVLANDGFGTNVISNKYPLTVTISGTTQTDNLTGLPQAPVVRSLDSFLPSSWQNVKSASFAWDLPSGITASELSFSKTNNPTSFVTYIPAISKKTVNDLSEGVWYMNVRLQNTNGLSKIGNFRLNIDQTPPEIPSASSIITSNDLISFSFKATDNNAGLEKYEIAVDKTTVSRGALDDNNQTIILPPQLPGDRNVRITVFDKAGNPAEKTLTVRVPEIGIPNIIEVPEKIQGGEKIKLTGLSPYPNTDIVVFLEQPGRATTETIIKVGENKRFTFTSDYIENEGVASIWLKTSRGPGVVSEASNKTVVTIGKSLGLETGSRLVSWLSIIVPVIALCFLLIFGIYFSYIKMKIMKRKLKRDLEKTETEIHEMFIELQKDLRRQLRSLEKTSGKRELTEEEQKILEKFTEHTEMADRYFSKKLRDIEEKDL